MFVIDTAQGTTLELPARLPMPWDHYTLVRSCRIDRTSFIDALAS